MAVKEKRKWGLGGLHRDELLAFYPEIETAAVACRFNDCLHDREPGCAVKAAVANGVIAEWRFENYKKLYSQLPA